MTTTSLDLATEFHNLDGTLIGEKKKNLYKLLKAASECPETQQLDTTLSKIQPTTYLEELFKVDILIYFRRVPELLEILKTGNEVFVSKILKQQWFFTEAFKNINIELLVNEILPCMSFPIRIKVIKKLTASLTEIQINEIFDSLLTRYGLFTATNVLSSCSVDKIELVLKDNFVKLATNQLIRIFEKSRTTLEFYFDEYEKDNRHILLDEKLFTHIVRKDPSYFFFLKEKYQVLSNLKVGRRTTKKIIAIKKSEIISNKTNCAKMLRTDALVRKLQVDFKELFFNLFPRDLKNPFPYDNNCRTFLKYYPKKYQYLLYTTTFNRVFKTSIWDHPLWIEEEFIKNISDPLDKEKWAQLKYDKTNDVDLMKYFSPKKCILILKEKINLTSNVKERTKMLQVLVNCCAENKDLNSLEEVLKYFCVRHRNEVNARSCILNAIEQNIELTTLNEMHWNYIKEIITIQRIKKTNLYEVEAVTLRKAYIEFLYKNKKPFKDEFYTILKDFADCGSTHYTFLDEDNIKYPQLKRQLFLYEIEIYPQLVDKTKTIFSFHKKLIQRIIEFNEKYNDFKINIFDQPTLVDIINTIATNNKPCHNVLDMLVLELFLTLPETNSLELGKKYLSSESESCYTNMILQLFFMTNKSDYDTKILKLLWKWHSHYLIVQKVHPILLKNAPILILDHFDGFTKYIKELNQFNLHLIKKYSHLQLDTKIIVYCEKCLADPTCKESNDLIKPLSVLMQPKDFVSIAEQFVPKLERVDLMDEEAKSKYGLQCAIASNLKNNNSVLTIPILLKYCVGDFLEFALKSLYSVFYKTPEKNLGLPLQEISKRAVSVRKHAMFLACNLLNQQEVLKMFKYCIATEKNISSQKQVFSSTFKYFVKNPSDDFWDLIEIYTSVLDKSDEESMESLSDIKKVPKSYRSLYLQCILKFYESFSEQNTKNAILYKSSLLYHVNKDLMESLPKDFCITFIQNYFLQDKQKELQSDVFDFVLNFLMVHNQKEDFKLVFSIIHTCWNTTEKSRLLYTFFETFYKTTNDTNLNTTYVINFIENYQTILKPIENFNEYVIIRLLDLKRKTPEPILTNFAKQVVLFQEELSSNFGSHILENYIDLVDGTLNKTEKYTFCLHMLQCKKTSDSCYMGLKFIKKWNSPLDDDNKKVYDSIIEILKNTDDPIFRLHFNIFNLLELQEE